MKREIKLINPKCSCCCPGHDSYPNDTYKNKRSKSKRSLFKQKEHMAVRRIVKLNLKKENINEED